MPLPRATMPASVLASQMILERCAALGFARAGIARALPTGRPRELRAWLDAGRHGEMAYLARTAEQRADPRRLLSGAASIIGVADRYHDGAAEEGPGPRRGAICRYARGVDYHVVIKKRLHALCDELRASFPGHAFRACVDTAPVLEREHAQRAGLGAVGKHTLLIEPGAGSYLLLGEILTTLALDPSEPCAADPCGACTRCIDACPTGAITPWSVDATRCISYLTIEHRSAIDPSLHAAMGQWIFGCDVCQEVCPHNQGTGRRRARAAVHPAYAARQRSLDLLEVLGWDEEARRRVFRGSAMKRAKLAMMTRNALIAAGNAPAVRDDPALRERIAALAAGGGEEPLVPATARVTLERLGG